MILQHKDYFSVCIPDECIIEEHEECIAIYKNDGIGSLVFSFYSIIDIENSICEHIVYMAKKYIDDNSIKLENSLIMREKFNQYVLYGEGTTTDDWYVSMWYIAKYPRVVVATYYSEFKTDEILQYREIVDSINLS